MKSKRILEQIHSSIHNRHDHVLRSMATKVCYVVATRQIILFFSKNVFQIQATSNNCMKYEKVKNSTQPGLYRTTYLFDLQLSRIQ